jgi:serine/threonine protein kinase
MATAQHSSPQWGVAFIQPYNHKSDVWALGVVLFELCTLKHPFDAQNQGALFMKIVKGKLDLSPVAKEYSPAMVEQIRRCLTRLPRSRPDTAALLKTPALAQWMNAHAVAGESVRWQAHILCLMFLPVIA